MESIIKYGSIKVDTAFLFFYLGEEPVGLVNYVQTDEVLIAKSLSEKPPTR